MKGDKKQTTQFIMLGALALVFIGFVSFQIIGSGASSKSASKTTTEKTQSTNENNTEQASDTNNSSLKDGTGENMVKLPLEIFPNLTNPITRRDPFVKTRLKEQVMPGIIKDVINEKINTHSSPKNRLPVPDFSKIKLPSMSIKPINPVSSSGGSVPSMTVSQPEPSFIVTGVVMGEQNIAIIRAGEGGRYVVREGQMVDGNYKLLSVFQDFVILGNGNHVIRVKVGGK